LLTLRLASGGIWGEAKSTCLKNSVKAAAKKFYPSVAVRQSSLVTKTKNSFEA
jgi:hypothetical protein